MGPLRERRVLATLAISYAVALALLVAGPWGWALNRFTVRCYVLFAYTWPIAPAWVGPEDYGVLLNVLLFVPVGALGVVLTRWVWWRVVLVAAIGSLAIETAQWLFLEREGGWGDLASNAAGALLGAVAVSLLARRR